MGTRESDSHSGVGQGRDRMDVDKQIIYGRVQEYV